MTVWVELAVALASAFVGWLARHYGVWMPPGPQPPPSIPNQQPPP